MNGRLRGGFDTDDRAVTDVVSYVLIFSLIVATVGVVTVVGYGTIDDRQATERVNNVERAFDVFAANMENVYRDGAPSRATEMRLSGGTIKHGDPVTIAIESANGDVVTTTTNPLVYADGNTDIVYVSGALIRSEGDSSVMLTPPPFRTDTSRASFPIVATYRTSGPTAVASDGTIRVTSAARGINTTVPPSFDSSGSYNITVESPRSDAWTRYFESLPNVTVLEHESERVVAEMTADGIAAPRFPIRLRFSQ